MPTPTINDAQAVDPVLTNMLIGYMQSEMRFVASRVFPTVVVDKDSGTFFIVEKGSFMADSLVPRAPGDQFEGIGYTLSTDTYKTLQYAAEQRIADEVRANSQVPLDLETIAVNRLGQASLIRKSAPSPATSLLTLCGAQPTTTVQPIGTTPPVATRLGTC